MKRIVGLLLLANLALFGWMRWGGMLTTDVDAVTAQAALNPDKIRLLALQPASGPAPASAPVGVALTLSPLVAIPAPVSAPAPAASGVALTSSPAAATFASAPAPAPASPRAALAPAPIAAASAPVVLAPSAATPPAPPKEANCAEWGEFSGQDLVRAQQMLATLKLGDKLMQRSVEQDHGYWVYVPPMKKHSQVERKIEQLKALGVKDYFVVQEKGRWLNAISLGVFKSNEAAQKYLAALRAKNVGPVKLGERKSKLKFTVFVIKGFDAGNTNKLKAFQKGFPGSELKVLACGN